MDQLFSAFTFLEPDDSMEDLADELGVLAQHERDDAPAFDRVLHFADSTGACLTAMDFEGEWSAVPTFRAFPGAGIRGSIYRATPFLGIVEAAGQRFAALADAPFALPAGNPAGGERLEGTLYPALVALHVCPGTASAGPAFEAPDTERFYRNYKPSLLTPRVRVSGAVEGATKRSSENAEYWVGTIEGLPVIFDSAPERYVCVEAIAVCGTGFWDSVEAP